MILLDAARTMGPLAGWVSANGLSSARNRSHPRTTTGGSQGGIPAGRQLLAIAGGALFEISDISLKFLTHAGCCGVWRG